MIKFIFLLAFFIASPAHANAGLPMLYIIWPIFLLALIPVILIESLVFKIKIPDLNWKSVISSVGIANIVSTLLGVPVTWILLTAIQLITPGGGGTYPGLNDTVRGILSVTLQAPWLLPYESEFYWMIPCAFLFLMIFFFIMSVYSERWFVFKILNRSHSIEKKATNKVALKANVTSYLFLILGAAFTFYYKETYSEFLENFLLIVRDIFRSMFGE
jgi:hypothetical protein